MKCGEVKAPPSRQAAAAALLREAYGHRGAFQPPEAGRRDSSPRGMVRGMKTRTPWMVEEPGDPEQVLLRHLGTP